MGFLCCCNTPNGSISRTLSYNAILHSSIHSFCFLLDKKDVLVLGKKRDAERNKTKGENVSPEASSKKKIGRIYVLNVLFP